MNENTIAFRFGPVAATIALASLTSVHAETVTVSCNNPARADYGSITAALAALSVEGPHTITVQPGVCVENVRIDSRERLLIEARVGNVSIVPADPDQDVIAISNSHNIVLRSISADSGGQHGFAVAASSGVRLESTQSNNNSRRGYDVGDYSSVHFVQAFATGNQSDGMLARGSYAHVEGGGFSANSSWGMNCRDDAICQLDGDTVIENNAEGGISVFNDSLLRMFSITNPVTPPSTIQGNGLGVALGGNSRAVMVAAAIVGNSGIGVAADSNSSVRLLDSSVVDNHEGGISIFANSSLDLFGSKVNDNRGTGILVDVNSTLAGMADCTVRRNTRGILIQANSIGLISDAAASNSIQGNQGANVKCDSMSLVRGDLSATRKVQCPNVEGI